MGCATPSFTQATGSPFAAGQGAHYVGLGFFNADNHLDIVTTDYSGGTVTILLGNGSGGFTTASGSPITVGTSPITAEVGDFNNDNKADLAVTNQGSDSLTILLGNGDGTFTPASGSPITVGSFPRSVAKGLFNGDNNLDLVVTNGGANNLTILLGNGDGTFTPASGSPLSGGGAPFHVVVGKFNADANNDLAVANFADGTVSIFLGDGNGGFTQSGTAITAGTFSDFIAIGQFNADANLDLAVTNRLDDNVVILLGNGDGSFSQATGSPYTVGQAPVAVAAGDLNSDGKIDLVASNESSDTVSILLGDGNGGFGSPFSFSVGQLPGHVALADLNEDNKLDFATGNAGANAVAVFLNTCNSCPTISVGPATIPAGTAGTNYSQTFTASGGTAPYGFALTGTLPAGMSFTSPTLSGTPTEAGSFPITVTATDASNCTGSANYTLVINCSYAINPTSQNFAAAGGSGSVTVTTQASCAWTAVSNDAWVTLDSSGGNGSGSVGFTVAANSGAQRTGTATIAGQTFTVTQAAFACPSITVNPSTIPAGTTGAAYGQMFTATGGTGPYGFALTGTLPTGISFTSPTLSGTPTQSGSFPVTVTATDASNCTGSTNYTLVINCPSITVSPSSLPNGFVGTAYSQTVTAGGGTAPYSFTISAGTQPAGLTLASDGGLSGTPTTAGTYNFTVKATDANGCAGTQSYTVIISGHGLMFYPLPRPVRLMDTRANSGNCDNVGSPITAGTSLTTLARTTCEGITIPATAQAVVGNLTAINQSQQSGYLTIYPDGVSVPVVSNMIYTPGQIIANNFTVALSSDGKFNVFGERTIDVVIDISGYSAPPGAGGLYYHPLSKPIRLLDTRANEGNCDNVGMPIAAGTSITTQARTTCEGLTIPAEAQALVANATVVNVSGQIGYMTIYPNGVSVPLASNIIYEPGQIISNAFTVSLNSAGEFNIFAERTIDAIVDVAGYYSAEATDAGGPGLLFTPLARPVRILDTRPNQGNCDSVSTPIAGGTSIAAPGRLTCEGITIPTTAQSLLGNVTVINQTSQAGYLTLYPDGVATPLISNMVYFPNQLLANAFVVGVNSGTGQFRIFAERTLDAIVDVSGYFAP
jgi:hypothetical protein